MAKEFNQNAIYKHFYTHLFESRTYYGKNIYDINKKHIQNSESHQGHIIPDNLIENVIMGIIDPPQGGDGQSIEYRISEILRRNNQDFATMSASITAATANTGYSWLGVLFNFVSTSTFLGDVQAGLTTIVSEEEPEYRENMIDRYQSLFSLLVWFPFNICDAPTDTKRQGYPGSKIDKEVINYLDTNYSNNISVEHKNWLTKPSQKLVGGQYVDTPAADDKIRLNANLLVLTLFHQNWLDQLIALRNIDNITEANKTLMLNYISACCNCLDMIGKLEYEDINKMFSYHSIPWETITLTKGVNAPRTLIETIFDNRKCQGQNPAVLKPQGVELDALWTK